MRRILLLATSAVCLNVVALAQPAPTTVPVAGCLPPVMDDDRPLVQVALLLDTSSSMDGLINQARSQLWTIVNEISKSKRNGKTPRLEVALFEYGNYRLAAGEGFIRMVSPLSGNLDDLSEKLFALTTNGGSEFCGQVVQQATTTLAWSNDPNVYKVIFIAGNEPFGQGTADFRSTVPAALSRGIVVNTIHCGDRGVGLEGGWAEGAKLGEGYFSNIDQNRVRVVPRCPQDDRIEKLSIEINLTYVPYGGDAIKSKERQSAQDALASAMPGTASAVQRAATKAGANYDNSDWDLVDRYLAGNLDLAKLDDSKLPEPMRGLSEAERKTYLEQKSAERKQISAEINKLVAERARFLAEHEKQDTGAQTLDSAMVSSIRDQLKARAYEVEK